MSAYLYFLEGQYGRKQRNAPYQVGANKSDERPRTQKTQFGRNDTSPEWQRAASLLAPRSKIGPIFGVTRGDISRAAASLSGIPHLSPFSIVIKRFFDIILSLTAVILLSPLFVTIAIGVKATSRGPILFKQERIGLNGRPVRTFKFRTMYVNSDAILSKLLRESSSASILFRLRDDPRITPFGRFLRRYSLDELPTFFSVLAGDMSIVGPRILLAREFWELKQDVARARSTVKPGITGLWAAVGRPNLSWEEMLKLDLYYVENWSLLDDFVILLWTVRVVLRRG